MAAYKGEYLLKNPFLGSSMVQRAKAGFAGSSEMLKRQKALYTGAINSSARGRSEYMAEIKPEHDQIVDRATEEVDVHGYARAHQQIQAGDTEQRQRAGLAQQQERGNPTGTIQRKIAKTVGNPGYEKQVAKRAGRLQDKATQQASKISDLESSGKVSPDKIARMKAKNMSLQEKADMKFDQSKEETDITGNAINMHGRVIGKELFNVRDSANTKNYFFGGSDFTEDVDRLTQQEQLEKAWMSSRTGYDPGYRGEGFRQFEKEDPSGYADWRKSKGRINEAFSPGMMKGYGQNYYKPRRQLLRGDEPLNLQTTGQGLFESGTALAREHLSGDRPLWERGNLSGNESNKQGKYGSVGNWLGSKYF